MKKIKYTPFDSELTDPMKKINYSAFREITDWDVKSGMEIRWAGYSKCKSQYNFTRVTKRYYMVYITEGKCIYKVPKGKNITLLPGDLIFLMPYTYQNLKVHESMAYYGTCFSGKAFDNILVNSKLNHTQIIKIGINDQIIFLFNQIINCILTRKPGETLDIANILFRLLAMINEFLTNNNNKKTIKKDDSQGILTEIVNCMNVNYYKKITIKEFADMARISVSSLEKLFKENDLENPKKYFINIKINKAKELFANSTLNISEVAHSLGFDDHFYFSRLFKNETGLSPRDYKKKVMFKEMALSSKIIN